MSVKVEFSTDGGETYKELGTVDLTTVEWDIAPPPPKVRLYNVLCVADGVELRVYLNLAPMTYHDAQFFRSQHQHKNPGSRLLIEEVQR